MNNGVLRGFFFVLSRKEKYFGERTLKTIWRYGNIKKWNFMGTRGLGTRGQVPLDRTGAISFQNISA